MLAVVVVALAHQIQLVKQVVVAVEVLEQQVRLTV
jgi:hypothetical protein